MGVVSLGGPQQPWVLIKAAAAICHKKLKASLITGATAIAILARNANAIGIVSGRLQKVFITCPYLNCFLSAIIKCF